QEPVKETSGVDMLATAAGRVTNELDGSSSALGTKATSTSHVTFTQLTPRESTVVHATRQRQIDRDHDIAVRLQACLETPRTTHMKSVVASPSTTSPGRGHATSIRVKRGKMFHGLDS
ncbi:hypothetical protein KI387_021096, partial [Taxus chinensis]